MKKVYLVKSGKEVKIGDVINIYHTNNLSLPHGNFSFISGEEILIDEISLPKLIKEGVITVKYINDNSKSKINKETESKSSVAIKEEIPMELEFYIQKIADMFGWKMDKARAFINDINIIFPAAAFSLLLRRIATEIDKKYKDHIKNSPKIYVISLLDGKIMEVNKANIKNYNNFAAFRTIDDAKIACRITKNILKSMFIY